MAGKKVQDEAVNKTARKNQQKGKNQEGFHASGDMERIVSLGGGTWMYVMDPRDGTTKHLEVGSARYNEYFTSLLADAKHGELVRAELVKKNFPFPLEEELEAVL